MLFLVVKRGRVQRIACNLGLIIFRDRTCLASEEKSEET